MGQILGFVAVILIACMGIGSCVEKSELREELACSKGDHTYHQRRDRIIDGRLHDVKECRCGEEVVIPMELCEKCLREY